MQRRTFLRTLVAAAVAPAAAAQICTPPPPRVLKPRINRIDLDPFVLKGEFDRQFIATGGAQTYRADPAWFRGRRIEGGHRLDIPVDPYYMGNDMIWLESRSSRSGIRGCAGTVNPWLLR